MSVLDHVLTDLAAESDQVDSWVAGVDDWSIVTTPEGWTIAHQIAHLHWTDLSSLTAIADVDAFNAGMAEAAKDPEGFVDRAAEELAPTPRAELLDRWRTTRVALATALRGVPDGEKIPWYGPPMSPTSMATARFMETWAHGHDVADAIGAEVPRTERVRHVCHLGVRTRGFAHVMRGEEPPTDDVRVELVSPAGEPWVWGDESAANRVTGSAWDFALLATRRRHRDDTDIVTTGPVADHWIDIIQAFAGLPGNDPKRVGER